MAKKYIQKALSVGLSLTLCASLVVPSFAATFTDLKNVIDTGEAYVSENGGIAVSTDEDGTRNIKLNEYVTSDSEKGIEIATNQKVVLDLNGQTITGAVKWDAALVVRGGDLTLKDSSEDQTGKVTGGGHAGVWVEANGSFTMEGGAIENNNSYNYTDGTTSSGVGVIGEGSSFIMTGGTIANNKGNGPAVAVKDGASFDMDGGLIESNATGNMDCVSVEGDNSYFTMTGGEINAAGDGKTVTGNESKVAIRGGTFSSLDEGYLLKGHTLVDGVFTHRWGDWANNGNGTQTRTCLLTSCGASETEKAETPDTTPDAPAAPVVSTPDEPVIEIDDPVIDIDDPAVPLAAGPVTCGEFIDYLWRHEGEPEADIVVDHEYAPAISWALSIDIISDDSFEPDELVTVAAVREILTNYAQYADLAMPELTTLTGEEDEAVLNCDEVLAEFFGEERSE